MSEVMSDDDDETVISASATIIFRSFTVLCISGLERKGRHFVWVRGYLQSRTKYGTYNGLVRDLQLHGSRGR